MNGKPGKDIESGYYGPDAGHASGEVPQDRQWRFRTEVFERYQRSEKALVGALMEMYVQGVSTRKVKAITEELCGHEVSASTISRMNVKLEEEFGAVCQAAAQRGVPLFGAGRALSGCGKTG